MNIETNIRGIEVLRNPSESEISKATEWNNNMSADKQKPLRKSSYQIWELMDVLT